MEEKRIGLPLKYKLLGLLTVIPAVSLVIYFVLATNEFKEDKIAYVHDSSAAVAKSLSTQVRAEVNSFLEVVRPIVSNYDQIERQFNPTGIKLFQNANRIDALVLFQKDRTGQYRKIGDLKRGGQFVDAFNADQNLIRSSMNRASDAETYLSAPDYLDKHIVIGYRAGKVEDSKHIVLVGLYRANELRSSFVDSKLYKMFLIDKQNRVFIGADDGKEHIEVFKKVNQSKLPEGSLEVSTGEDEKLAGFSGAGISGLSVASVVYKRDALIAVENLFFKSLVLFAGLIAAIVIISLLSAVQLTSALRDLYEATKKIAKGDFSIRVERKSNDEVGGLAEGFNFMAGEVSRLMKETADAARMQGELETVKIVQETLFPEDKTQIGDFNISGHFEPASECGGDWWNYSKIDDKLFLWIGDATGHGAPAAMVTSAAKAAATIVEDMPFITPAKALTVMNKAIHETSKGKILMTFFVASIDLKTGEMIYSNASHEPPYVMRKKEGKFTKKDLEPLLDSNGARLGDNKDSEYNEGKFQLNPGDSILFYTDGIVDLESPEGKVWGERGFIRTLVQSAQQGPELEPKMLHMKQKISEFRSDTELVDDITLFMCQYEEVA